MVEYGQPDVILEMGMQREYLSPTGIRRCQNADHVYPRARRLMAYARWTGTRVLSCIDLRRPSDLDDYFPTDVAIAPEAHLPPFALLPDHTVVEGDNCLCVPLNILQFHQQTIFIKYHRDPFTNPKLDRLLTEMPAGRFVVFGMPLESSVRLLVLGLLRRNRRVAIVEDACGWRARDEGQMVLRQLSVKNCEMLSTDAFIESQFERQRMLRRRLRARRSVA